MDKDFNIVDTGFAKVLTVESDRLDVCMGYLNDHEGVTGVYLNRLLGYKLKDISCLRDFPNIEALIVSDNTVDTLKGIEDLKKLKYISIYGQNYPIDFSIFPELEVVRNEWHPKMSLLRNAKK